MESSKTIYNKRAFSVAEAAEYACVGRSTMEGWITKGLLPYEELPGRGDNKYRFLRIRRHDLDTFLDKYYTKCGLSLKKKENEKLKHSSVQCSLLPRSSC